MTSVAPLALEHAASRPDVRIPFTVLVLAMLPAVLGRYRGGDLLYTRFAVTDTRVRIQGQAAIVVGVQEQQGRFRDLPADARLRLTLSLTGVDGNDPQISGVHLSPMEAPPLRRSPRSRPRCCCAARRPATKSR